MKRRNGGDLSKWWITKGNNGKWLICGPSKSGKKLTDTPVAVTFDTGAQALTAFAMGGRQA